MNLVLSVEYGKWRLTLREGGTPFMPSGPSLLYERSTQHISCLCTLRTYTAHFSVCVCAHGFGKNYFGKVERCCCSIWQRKCGLHTHRREGGRRSINHPTLSLIHLSNRHHPKRIRDRETRPGDRVKSRHSNNERTAKEWKRQEDFAHFTGFHNEPGHEWLTLIVPRVQSHPSNQPGFKKDICRLFVIPSHKYAIFFSSFVRPSSRLPRGTCGAAYQIIA